MKQSILDNPETGASYKDTLAELIADGATRKAIGEVFGVSADTITDWKKRSDVQARVAVLVQQRANRILSQVDSRIAAKLEARDAQGNPVPIPLKDLFEARRTYAGSTVNVNPGDKAAAMGELVKALHEDPELAQRLMGALEPADADLD